MMRYKPFDPADPAEQVADHIRKEIGDVALRIMDDPVYLSLSPIEQIEAFMSGALTGVVCCCFAHIRPEGRRDMMKAIRDYLPHARNQAIGIKRESRH